MLPTFAGIAVLCKCGTNCIMYQKNNNTFNMNTNKIFTKVEPSYEAPSVTSLDILSEGLLCQSGMFTLDEWENDDESLNFI